MHAPKNTSSDFEKHPAGSVALVCTRIIDKGTTYNEHKQKDERKLIIAYESTKLMQEGEYAGQPFLVFANFNYSMYQNSMLCKHIEAWLGKKFADQNAADKFDIESLLRKPAFGNIIHSDDGKWVNIGSIMPLPEGMTAPKPVGDVYCFDMDNINMDVFEKMSERMQESIKQSKEWSGEPTKNNPQEPVDMDNIPPSPPIDSYDDKIPF